jgi:hypothetical protein
MSFDQTHRFGRFLMAGGFALGCVTIVGSGCGGDDSSTTPGGDDGGVTDGSGGDGTTPDSGGGETGTHDSSTDSGVDSSPGDGSTDANDANDASADAADAADTSTACTGTETACTTGTTTGLCVSGVCTACSDPADDTNCATAYAGAFLCDTAGSCVAGNCHTDANCTTPGQICGITTPNTCGACSSDAQCESDPSYGPGTICSPANGGTCVSGTGCTIDTTCANTADICCASGASTACVPGSCCTNAQCTNAASPICGATTANVCGPCTLDSQCSTGQVCDTMTGACATNAGLCTGAPTALGGDPGTCANIGTDVCCSTGTCFTPAGGGSTACCPGTSGNTYCQGVLQSTSATCTAGNTCTTCTAVSTTTPVYTVDPVNGNDGATGSAEGADGGAAASCALKTITRAIELIGTTGVATTIVVVGGTSVTVGAGETFPIAIPANVTITSSTGPVTVQVPNGKSGFTIAKSPATLTSGTSAPITITTTVTVNSGTTAPTGGTNGISVATGSTAASSISDITISGMLNDGIHVASGVITIGEGVVSTQNGIAPTTRNGYQSPGLHVTGTGEAIITVPAGDTPTEFNANTAHGILVDQTGFIDVNGVVTNGAAGTGTIQTNGNLPAGIWIQQTPGATVPQNTITGVVSYGNTAGNGMRIVAGSSIVVRNSAFLANSGDGVIISTYGTGATAVNDISKIDLGDIAANGANTFQAPLGAGNNGNAGLCLAVAANSGTLGAIGNQFSAANCATTAATLTLNTNGCGNSANRCASGVCDLGFGTAAEATGNSFDVSMCTQ